MTKSIRKLSRSLQSSQYGATHPIDDEQWRSFEKILGEGLHVPDSYKKFMYLYNGGVFNESALFSVPWGPIIVSTFFPLFTEGRGSVTSQLKYFVEEYGPGYIPIADDPGGNYYLLGCGAENAEKVYFWNHEDETLTQIFDSFVTFLDSLAADEP
jgi:hypothetical protein